MGGSIDIPIKEIDATGNKRLNAKLDPTGKFFTFTLVSQPNMQIDLGKAN